MAVECNKCLPLECLVKVDLTIQDVVEQQEFNCLAILSTDPNCGIGLTPSPVDADTCIKEYVVFEDMATEWDSTCDVYNAAQHAFAQTPRVGIVKVMYFDPAGDVAAQLDALFGCEDCQGIIAPSIHDDPAIVLAIADWVESKGGEHFYFTDTNDILTLDPNDATSIAALMCAAGYKYSAAYYHSDETEEFAAAALSFGLGQDLDLNGSVFTMAFNDLALVAPDYLTKSELVAATGHLPAVGCSKDFGKFANVYTCVGNNNMMLYGSMADGNFLDTNLLSRFMEARIQEIIAQSFLDGSVPYTPAGAQLIANQVDFILAQFQDAGWITDFIVQPADVASASAASKACRVMDCAKFKAVLANRVHSTCVIGELTF